MSESPGERTRVALVTGANRGIGFEVARQLARRGYAVILASRDPQKGERAAARLEEEDLSVLPRQLDVSDVESIEKLAARIVDDPGRLDVLVNNAAIHYDTWQRVLDADLDIVREVLETNTFGAWRTCKAFVPLLRDSDHGRIVNVSSGAGSLASMGRGTPAYNVSKVALNALTRMLAAELRGTGILVNAVDPGWTATEVAPSKTAPLAWCGPPPSPMTVPLAVSSTTANRKPGRQTFSRKEQELSEIDNTVKRLDDEAEIRRVVDGIDLATDAKDWELCRGYFTDEIFADFTSLAGGEPARMPAGDLVNAWKTNLYADKLSHHMRTNHRISLQGDRAEVFSKGYALNILERGTCSDLWEVWGEYTHTLERTPEGWRCSGMAFTVTHARGNEMAREFIPDE